LETLTEPAPALAVRVLERLHRKALKKGARFGRLQPEARHDLRVTLKKLRYATEFFLPVFGGQAAAKRYVARLSKLQDALGRANDSTATRSLLGVAGEAGFTPDLHRAAGALIGWVARDQLAVDKSLRKRWREFKAAPGFWRA
jgi:triphosphatase